jgi:hypothetical protein
MSLTVVAEFNTMPEAQIAATVLQSAGIMAVVMDGADNALYPIGQPRTGYRLGVSEDDLYTARQVLAAAEEAGGENRDGDDQAGGGG